MSEPVSSDLDSSLRPDDVWARSPLNHAQITRVLDASGLPLKSDDDREALILTLAKLLDLAVPHVLFWSKPANWSQIKAYVDAVRTFSRAAGAMQRHSNAPPPIPEEWLLRTLEWFDAEGPRAPTKGRVAADGLPNFFAPMAAFYALAYGRKPAATPGGPAVRFFRQLWVELTEAVSSPRWPPMSDRALIARILENKDASPDERGPMWLPPRALLKAFKQVLRDDRRPN